MKNLNLIVLILINLCLLFFLNIHKETFYTDAYTPTEREIINKAQTLYGKTCTTEECLDDALEYLLGSRASSRTSSRKSTGANSGTTTTTIAPTTTTTKKPCRVAFEIGSTEFCPPF